MHFSFLIYFNNLSSTCVAGHKVDCIWFKSLDCGGTIALLNTHCSSSYSVAQCSTHSTTNSLIRLPSLDSNCLHDSHYLSDKTGAE